MEFCFSRRNKTTGVNSKSQLRERERSGFLFTVEFKIIDEREKKQYCVGYIDGGRIFN